MRAPVALTILLLLALAACGGKDTTRKPYYGESLVPPLEVPPDLTKPEDQGNTSVDGAANYSDLTKNKTGDISVLPQYDGIKLVSLGDTHWLFVKQAPDKLWNAVHDFILSQGLPIAAEDADLGIIDTEWVESRADTGDFIQKYIAKLAPKLFSSGLRDRYRVRLERVAGGTEIHIAHRGMEEVTLGGSTSSIVVTQTKWQRRPPDPELEVELLARLQEQLGGGDAKRITKLRSERAELTRNQQALWVIRIHDKVDAAWQRVGTAIDRLGYVIRDRDTAAHVYGIRYTVPGTGEEKSFWEKAIGENTAPPDTVDYRVALKAEGENNTVLQLLSKKGEPVAAKDAEPIMVQLYQQLK